jgi:hypothetical protein
MAILVILDMVKVHGNLEQVVVLVVLVLMEDLASEERLDRHRVFHLFHHLCFVLV